MTNVFRGFFSGRTPGDIILLVAMAAALLFSMISISLAEGFLAIALLTWLALLFSGKRRFEVPSFFWALAVYSGLSLLSAAASVNPSVSFWDCRKILIFLVVPIVCAAVRRRTDIKLLLAAVVLSAVANGVYAVGLKLTTSIYRIRSFMGHYMTQAGITAVFISLALGILFAGFIRRPKNGGSGAEVKKTWAGQTIWAFGLLLAATANLLTFTRGAWIGIGAALVIAVFLWKPKWLVVIPVIGVLGFFVAPKPVRDRAMSIFTMRDDSNIARVEYFKAGMKIIRDYPLLGTGPDTVDMVFQDEKYGLGTLAKHNVHLHNNLIQIAAERGSVTALAWLAFIGLAAAGLWRNRRLPPDAPPVSILRRQIAAGGLCVLTAVFIAGFFEYNFGDSEIAQLLLILISLPTAAARLERESHEQSPVA